jgi:outer membrane protein TolC
VLEAQYGRITQFEMTQQQQDLINDQLAFVGAQIAYLNTMTLLYQDMGTLLSHWNIQLRY